ncbi:uncharacterized protein LOC113290950 [Papaver somniferum]|uniref:uncharacterized protein LOC113290950 n=1 Tax=Papaver somniferum TaxID=3469 RepID=UPI000E6FCBE0|nr:uncharacterized protein LOC113290950 [Papaver somniferum]
MVNISLLEKLAWRLVNEEQAMCSGTQHKSHIRNCIAPAESWKKPPENWLKINIDASFYSQNSNAGFALIVRDHAGIFVAAMAYSARARDVNQAESLILLKALQWINLMKYQNVIVEGDNRSVVNCCNGRVEDFQWEDQNIISDCQKIL